jgi:ribosome-binding protein aMBF1 (putative translation factor)
MKKNLTQTPTPIELKYSIRTKKNAKTSDEVLKLCNLVIEARLSGGISQAELARRVGTKQPNIARIECGLMEPSISFLIKVAKAVNMELVLPKLDWPK